MRAVRLAVALSIFTATPAFATTIGFDELVGPGPFTFYTTSGFVVRPVDGLWSILSYGVPAPSVYFVNLDPGVALSHSVEVTAGGSLFDFTSVDLYSSITPIPYVFTGYLGATPVFTASGIVPNTFGSFAGVAAHATAIDRLVITLTNPLVCCAGNPVGLDNIVVVPAEVTPMPEPSILLLLAGGAVAARLRRARQ